MAQLQWLTMDLPTANLKRKRLAFSLLLFCFGCGCFDWTSIAGAACVPPEGCQAALAFYYVIPDDTLDGISSRFQTDAGHVYNFNYIPNPNNISQSNFLFIPFRCLCSGNQLGFTFSYEVQADENIVDIANQKFNGLSKQEWIVTATSLTSPRNIFPGFVLRVPVNCSCGDPTIGDSGLFTTYAVQYNDTLASISTQFNVSQEQLQQYNNGIDWSALKPQEDILFLPFTGRQRYDYLIKTSVLGRKGRSKTATIVGASIGGAFALLILAAVGLCSYFICFPKKDQESARKDEQLVTAIRQEGSSVDITRKRGVSIQLSENSSRSIVSSRSAQTMSSELTIDKAVEFSYEELAAATGNFSDCQKIGEGGYGSVYYGFIQGQKLAVKRMNLQATKEFLAELKVLTHVHHTNLVQLIGFCTVESLFLVYEYVENGTLSQHLHGEGFPTLSWTTRIQIALDAARGLEYIHEHTKPTYIHRDVKSSNILIDNNLHAKVADFGLTKLTESGIGSLSMTMPTRLVGTFGYMSPEYARFGDVSPEVDVYSFGVVLFEIISAKEAIVRTTSDSSTSSTATQDQQGLVTLFESVLKDSDGMDKLRSLVDPSLGDDYPLDSVWKMAQLAGACTLENPHLRPKMRTVVVALMTLSSIQDGEPSGYRGGQVLGSLLSTLL